MRIGITGSSGLIGTALRQRLEIEGHEVRPFLRGKPDVPAALLDPAAGWVRPGALEGLDALVHLAGESIGEGRWTKSRKAALRASRIDTTRLLVSHLERMTDPPAFIAASAVGIYGSRGDEVLDEASKSGGGFLAELTQEWEAELHRAECAGARTVILRLGVVLAREGGALSRMALPFKFGLGGRLGSGRQWFSWVAIDDAVAVISRAITSDMSGVYNVTAPQPVTNRDLTKALASVLQRPAFFAVPAVALRGLLGGAADELLLTSQRVVPRRLEEAGFSFRHPEISSALNAALGGS
jgi:uncharacterized protein (TIGR01777 family)